MISDAVAAGKPVGLVPVHAEGRAGAWLRLVRKARRAASGEEGASPPVRVLARVWGGLVRRGVVRWPRDLWFFWREVERRGLAGTADRPARGETPHSIAEAAASRVRLLLPSHSPPATGTDRGGALPVQPRREGRDAA